MIEHDETDDPTVTVAQDLRELEPCGTYAAYQRHRRRGEPIDEACRQANAAYRREWRETKRAQAERHRNAARSRALWRLADLHPDEFTSLYLREVLRTEETAR